MMKTIFPAVILAAAMILPSCASISESECAAGNWDDLGYRDGLNGVNRGQIAEYSTKCSEYGFDTDSRSYERGYERGLALYCVPEKGFDRGRDGNSYNGVCAGTLYAEDYRIAFEDGRAEYEIEAEHKRLIERMEDYDDSIADVRARMRDPETSEEEYNRLRQKRDRLEDERSDTLRDLRRFERVHGLYGRYKDGAL